MTDTDKAAPAGHARVEELDAQSAAEFAALLPRVNWLKPSHEPERFGATSILGVRSQSGEPAVVAVVRLGVGAEPARLIWLGVSVQHQGRGLATRMLGVVEQWASQRGARALAASFMDSIASSAALWKIFERAAWAPPQPALKQYTFAKGAAPHVIAASRHWLGRRELPAGTRIVPWQSLDALTLSQVESQAAAGTLPEALSPFVPLYVASDPDTSVAWLSATGAVLGWMINLRVGPAAVLYDRLFVDESMRGLGASHALVAAALEAHFRRDGDGSIGAFRHHVDNREMAAFAKRRLAPFAASITQSYAVEKLLGIESAP